MAEPRPPRRHGRDVAIVVALTLLACMLAKAFLMRTFYLPSASMEPTLHVGDRVAVNLLVPEPLGLRRGDVVVFEDTKGWLPPAPGGEDALADVARLLGLAPEDAQTHLIKRVVGLPGDTVAWHPGDAHLSVNGRPVEEPRLAPGTAPSDVPFEVSVPPGRLWVMGDNRPASSDSRRHQDGPGGGFVDVHDVVGRADAVLWPPARIGPAGSDPDSFAAVPDPGTRS